MGGVRLLRAKYCGAIRRREGILAAWHLACAGHSSRLPKPFQAVALPITLGQAHIGKLMEIKLAQAPTCLQSHNPGTHARDKPALPRNGRSMHLVHRLTLTERSPGSYGERRNVRAVDIHKAMV